MKRRRLRSGGPGRVRKPAGPDTFRTGASTWFVSPVASAALFAASLFASLVASAAPLEAQGVRGSAQTMVRYYEIRPLVDDTIPFADVEQRGDGTFFYEGRQVVCNTTAFCMRFLSGEKQGAAMLTQDVAMTAWGLGVEGLSATVQLRARADLGGDELSWPRADDHFDAMLAYAELLRGDFRVRAGRLQNASGLGFSSYDGAHVLYTPIPGLSVQAFGGRSLARGLYEPRHEALEGIEEFFPDRNAAIVGGEVEGRPWSHTSIAARYQREIWWNRSALVSERASLDITSSALAPVQLRAGMDYDFAFGHIGKANLNVSAPVSNGRVMLEARASRYMPYFELWTIWGYFSPVGYNQVEGRAAWRALDVLQLRGSVGYRRYEDAHAPVIFEKLPQDAVSVELDAVWTATPSVVLDARYRLERGFGAYLGSADLVARYRLNERVNFTVDGSAFQQIEQFRLGDGVVLGGGGSLDVQVTPFANLSGGAHVYRQTWDNRPGDPDWNQVRAWAALRLGFGRDPGLREGTR
ncbi:MAG TPA: hypothetical protein VFU06_15280 [Longimicrobiales bacterium]|nr:hypothetical protein [Longimicrobiales bacterium]